MYDMTGSQEGSKKIFTIEQPTNGIENPAKAETSLTLGQHKNTSNGMNDVYVKLNGEKVLFQCVYGPLFSLDDVNQMGIPGILITSRLWCLDVLMSYNLFTKQMRK